MDNSLYEVLIQTAYYAITMILTIFFIAALLRGFFWKYVKVRTSVGKYFLIKIRNNIRDHFAIGWVEKGFICYKVKESNFKSKIMRTNLPSGCIYRSLSVNWVDLDEEKNAICKADYSTVSGFDAQKFSDLFIRALMTPSVKTGQEKIIIILIIVVGLIGLANIYYGYINHNDGQAIITGINNFFDHAKGTILGTSTTI